MSAASSSSSGGIGVLGLLGVVFVTLKLIGVITWSWWWVTAPFWSVPILAVLAFVVAFVVLLVRETRKTKRHRPY